MKALFSYLTAAYGKQPLIYTKKAVYASLLCLFIIGILLFTLPLALRDLEYAPVPVAVLVAILLLCLLSLRLIRRGHLESAVNILLALGFIRVLMLFPDAYAILMYITSAVIIISTAICQIRPYQIVAAPLLIFGVHSAKLSQQAVLYQNGQISHLVFDMHLYSFLHVCALILVSFFIVYVIRSEIQKSEALISSQQQLSSYAEKLEELNALLEDTASRDRLTGAYNRRKMDEIIRHEAQRHDGSPLKPAMVMFDLDAFKLVNDTYGHQAGDVVLARTAQTVLGEIRKSDYLIRWGGEEFLLLLFRETPEGTRDTAERLRKLISLQRYHLPGAPEEGVAVTASFGYATPRQEETAEGQINRADTALYEAKRAGKNCVVGE